MREGEKFKKGRQALLALFISAALVTSGCAEVTGPGAVFPKVKNRTSYQQQEEEKKKEDETRVVPSGRVGSGGWYWYTKTPGRTTPAETAPGESAPTSAFKGGSTGSSTAGKAGSLGSSAGGRGGSTG